MAAHVVNECMKDSTNIVSDPICAFRSIHEAARDVARRIAGTPEYLRSRCERKKVEMLFAHLKRILKLDRLRLRGLSGASDEFTLAAAVQNLRRLAKLAAQAQPIDGIGAPA
jgi:hypothetical protein